MHIPPQLSLEPNTMCRQQCKYCWVTCCFEQYKYWECGHGNATVVYFVLCYMLL